MENAVTFDSLTQTLKAFAVSIDAEFSESKGVTETELQLSKSALSKWFDRHFLDSITGLWGENRESTKREFDTLYHNAFIKFKHKSRNVQFRFRCLGPLPGQFEDIELRVTSLIDCGDFRYLMLPSNGHVNIKKSSFKPQRIEWPFSEFFPEGLVKDMNLNPGKTNHVLAFSQKELDERYQVNSNDEKVGEALVSDDNLQQYLSKIDQLSTWHIGHFDVEEGTGQVFELRLQGSWDTASLQTCYAFVIAALDAFDQTRRGSDAD